MSSEGPPPSFRHSIAMSHSPYPTSTPLYSSSPPPSQTIINPNRLSYQQQPIGDALEPLRSLSPSSPSPLSNRHSMQNPNVSPIRDNAAALIMARQSVGTKEDQFYKDNYDAIVVKPPTYSQSEFDERSNNNNLNTSANIYSTVMGTASLNSSVNENYVMNTTATTDMAYKHQILPIQQVNVSSSATFNQKPNTVADLNGGIAATEVVKASPREIWHKSSLSKTVCGCLGYFFMCPMLSLVCLFSIIEVAAIILFQSLSKTGYDTTDTSNNQLIYLLVMAGQAVTFIAVLLCCAGSTFMAVSSMCDNTLSKKDTKNRFIISMSTLIVGLVFIGLLLVRGGLEGYATKLLVDKVTPTLTTNFPSSIQNNISSVPILIILAMFGLCVLTVLVCGAVGFMCCFWFCCCSTRLYAKERKREKLSKKGIEV